MQSAWDPAAAARAAADAEAAGLPPELGERVYSSRLIGQDPDLTLHGGGNTSLKLGEVMYVKGSGWDLATIEAPGLPGVRLAPLQALEGSARLSDEAMVARLRTELLDPAAPTPSVEALLHAWLPAAVVDHGHCTAVLALADQPDSAETVRAIYGDRLAYVTYVMPGYDLAVLGAQIAAAQPQAEGLWLHQHGLFTWGATARESYERFVDMVTLAEAHLAARGLAPQGPEPRETALPQPFADHLGQALAADGHLGPAPAMAFVGTPALRALTARPDAAEILARGTPTPDHVIRIKPFPMFADPADDTAALAARLADFATRYRAYFNRHAPRAAEPKVMLDPAPRAVVLPGIGVIGLGRSARDAGIIADLWEQGARIIAAAEAWGRYTPIAEPDLFDMEYWSLEQAKLKKA